MSAEVLREKLSDPFFAEEVSVVPVDGTEDDRVTLGVRVLRQSASVMRMERKADESLKCSLHVLAVDDADHGGLVAPKIGDTWKLARVEGGTAEDGWKAGSPLGHNGFWEIPVTLTPRHETGAKRDRL